VLRAGVAAGPSPLTPAERRELGRRRETLRRIGGGIPHAVVRQHWLGEMARELGRLARDYDGSARAARRLLEALLIAEQEEVAGVAEIRRGLAVEIRRRRVD
jgi:hypothetical protein